MKFSWFHEQPPWLKALILGGGIGVAIGVFYLLDLHPKFQSIEKQKREITRLTAENDSYRKEILRFKKPTKAERTSWKTLSSKLIKRIPEAKDVLKAAKLLAEKAVEYHLMEVNIKMPTQLQTPTGPLTIAGKEAIPSAEKQLIKELKLQSFMMEISYTSSLKESLSFLDALITDPNTFLHVKKVIFKKDFPFIQTQASIRFYYGGDLHVEE